jgi:hypothetical protein
VLSRQSPKIVNGQKHGNQQRFGTNRVKVDALHEQYETAVEDESDDDQMIGASDDENEPITPRCLTSLLAKW